MVLAGKVLEAALALEWGLINEVVQPGELVEKVEETVERLAQGGRIALFQAKRCLNHSLDMDLNRGLEYETECYTTCFSTGEPAQGLKRFTGKTGEAEQAVTEAAAAEVETAPGEEALEQGKKGDEGQPKEVEFFEELKGGEEEEGEDEDRDIFE
jgi:enoyl-CoA hydratase/carnithine racemase